MESVRIPLNAGLFALVDAADADLVSQRRWRITRGSRDTLYARSGPAHSQVWMHRLILGLPPGRFPEVDHVNNDGLDNRRANLRVATRSQNGANARRKLNNTSGCKGVYPIGNLWGAKLGKYLGMFDTAAEAGRAYDTAARERYGAFAKLNFPDETVPVGSRVGVPRRANTSGYRGVGFRKPARGRQGGWTARFAYKGSRLFLGYFATKEAAARAWDAKAIELLGPNARLNLPGG